MDWIKAKPKMNWTKRDVALLAAGVAVVVVVALILLIGKAGKVQAPASPAATQAAKADAAELLRRAEEKYAEGRKAYESGLAFSGRRLCGEAVELYRKYLEIIPGDLRAMSDMAGAALYAGEIDAAREAYRQALEEGQRWLAATHVGYAVLLHDHDGDYRGAAEHLREAAGLDPGGDAGKKAREMLVKMVKTE